LPIKCGGGAVGTADINEKSYFGQFVDARNSDPDLLIRTSGEMRVSNFYSGKSVTPNWSSRRRSGPDFRKPQFFAALE